jgi:hypothetical protein
VQGWLQSAPQLARKDRSRYAVRRRAQVRTTHSHMQYIRVLPKPRRAPKGKVEQRLIPLTWAAPHLPSGLLCCALGSGSPSASSRAPLPAPLPQWPPTLPRRALLPTSCPPPSQGACILHQAGEGPSLQLSPSALSLKHSLLAGAPNVGVQVGCQSGAPRLKQHRACTANDRTREHSTTRRGAAAAQLFFWPSAPCSMASLTHIRSFITHSAASTLEIGTLLPNHKGGPQHAGRGPCPTPGTSLTETVETYTEEAPRRAQQGWSTLCSCFLTQKHKAVAADQLEGETDHAVHVLLDQQAFMRLAGCNDHGGCSGPTLTSLSSSHQVKKLVLFSNRDTSPRPLLSSKALHRLLSTPPHGLAAPSLSFCRHLCPVPLSKRSSLSSGVPLPHSFSTLTVPPFFRVPPIFSSTSPSSFWSFFLSRLSGVCADE